RRPPAAARARGLVCADVPPAAPRSGVGRGRDRSRDRARDRRAGRHDNRDRGARVMTQVTAMAAEDEIFGKAYDRRLTARLLRYLLPYRRWVAVSVVLLLLLSLAAVAPAIIAKLVIDEAITP